MLNISRSVLISGITLLFFSCSQVSQSRPDILLFIADDMSWWDCEPYGNPDIQTPNLSKLANEGLCFDQMYTPTAMCGPTRQALYTGIYPVRNGSYPNHARVYDSITSIAHHFRQIGYRVALMGKQHYAPMESFPFEYLGGRNGDDGSGQDINLGDAEQFINSDRSKPYLLIVATNQPHSPWNRGNQALYDPDSLNLPPYMVDTRETREELVHYYAEITYADSLMGYCMDMVDRNGNSDNTMLIFTSEQGNSFPFGKWTCYNAGLKTAFIVRWPERIEPGSRTDVLSQYIDVVPTLYEAAGGSPLQLRGNVNGTMLLDGKSFFSALNGETHAIRKYAFGIHTTRGINNGSVNYPVRSILDKRHKLIWNLNYQEPFYCNRSRPGSTMYEEWLSESRDDSVAYSHALLYRFRPEFELYDLESDPFELTNLLDSKEDYTQIRDRLLGELQAWMEDQGDKGIATEWKALTRFKGDTLRWKPYLR